MWGPADDGVQWTNNAALDGASFAPLAMSPPFRPAPRMLPAPQRPIYVTQPSPSPVRMVQGPPPQVVVQQPQQQQQAPPGLWDEDRIIRACLICTYRTCVCLLLPPRYSHPCGAQLRKDPLEMRASESTLTFQEVKNVKKKFNSSTQILFTQQRRPKRRSTLEVRLGSVRLVALTRNCCSRNQLDALHGSEG